MAPAVHPFGYSRSNQEPVLSAIAERFPATLELLGVSIVMAFAAALICRLLAAIVSKPVVRYTVLALHSVPYFWLAIMLEMVLAEHGVSITADAWRLWTPAFILALFLLPPITEFFIEHLGSAVSPRTMLVSFFARFADRLPQLIGALLLTEVVFAWPGEGRIAYYGLGQSDLPLVTGGLLLCALLVLLVRLIARVFALLTGAAEARIDV
jgi:peptide/nickel transport system permease protein